MTSFLKPHAFAASLMSSAAFADPGAYLEITLKIASESREAAAAIYTRYKEPFPTTVAGAESKVLLVREADVQVPHGLIPSRQRWRILIVNCSPKMCLLHLSHLLWPTRKFASIRQTDERSARSDLRR